jgi:agmatine deiminase
VIEFNLSEKGIKVEQIDSDNLWCRDYMPIKIGDEFVKFAYKNNVKKYPWLHVPVDCWSGFNVRMSDIYLDGGNVVQNDNVVFMTEQVFKNNPAILRIDLRQFLRDIFEKKIIYIPVEPGDDLGHADGIVRFKNDKTVIINDYSLSRTLPKMLAATKKLQEAWNEYSEKLEKVISAEGFDIVKIPWAYSQCPQISETEFREKYPFGDDWNPGFGYYINFFHVEDMIFLPQFGIKEDMTVMLFMQKHFSGFDIVPVDCSDLSMLGGLLNCISWSD